MEATSEKAWAATAASPSFAGPAGVIQSLLDNSPDVRVESSSSSRHTPPAHSHPRVRVSSWVGLRA